MTITQDDTNTRMVFVTCPDKAVARDIAAALIEHHEAACVNIVPGLESVYRWQGRVETDAETLLLIKTRADRVDAVERRVNERHPDDLPEVVAVALRGGSQGYIDWVKQEAASR